jgi:hypothetical protein
VIKAETGGPGLRRNLRRRKQGSRHHHSSVLFHVCRRLGYEKENYVVIFSSAVYAVIGAYRRAEKYYRIIYTGGGGVNMSWPAVPHPSKMGEEAGKIFAVRALRIKTAYHADNFLSSNLQRNLRRIFRKKFTTKAYKGRKAHEPPASELHGRHEQFVRAACVQAVSEVRGSFLTICFVRRRGFFTTKATGDSHRSPLWLTRTNAGSREHPVPTESPPRARPTSCSRLLW